MEKVTRILIMKFKKKPKETWKAQKNKSQKCEILKVEVCLYDHCYACLKFGGYPQGGRLGIEHISQKWKHLGKEF